MKKMFLATCLLAASVFAAPKAAPAAAPKADAPKAEATKAEPAKAEAPKAEAAKAEPAKAEAAKAEPAKAEAPKAEAAKAEPAKAEAPKAEAAKAEPAKAEAPKAEAPKAEEAKAEAPAAAPADSAAAPAAEAAAAPADSAAAPAETAAAPADSAAAPVAEAAEAPAEQPAEVAAEAAPAAEVAAAEPEQKPAKKKKRKKKKMIEKAVVETPSLAFDVQADFELEAGKVFWSSEDDPYGDNLETWNGEANFAVLAEGDDFKGKIGVAFYPGDLKYTNDDEDVTNIKEAKKAKKEALRNGTNKNSDDYFSLDEAWAMQGTDYFVFKVGRWDNTDKNGDYFGGYIDGYLTGFMSTQESENQLQFGFTPNDNVDFFLSFISQSPNLDKGDMRLAFNFHGLESIHDLNVQLAYRSNIFDKVYDADVDVVHNASLKANLPIVKNRVSIFAEAALMNIDPNDDMVIPVTGGIAFETKAVDRIILEAEWIKDRYDTEFKTEGAKHVKDVLGAVYLEKAFTDRFSLSAGFHSFGSTRDYMLSGNLVGRIN